MFGDSVAEWLARRTRNPEVAGSGPTLTANLGCFVVKTLVQLLGRGSKQPSGLSPRSWDFSALYVNLK